MAAKDIDLRAAINAISDVVQNRPRPLREFDQIYMKTGDMVLQSELIANWANGKRLSFIGDGDAISICVAYLHKLGIVDYGPSAIVVYDFDERVCSAVQGFADRQQLGHLQAHLYNCFDPFPEPGRFECFYTNPPWGASNGGERVKLFARRGMESVGYCGKGVVVMADDDQEEWPKRVLANMQRFALESGFYVQRMMTQVHKYHLDDDPDLRSCNLMLNALPRTKPPGVSAPVTEPSILEHFYGCSAPARVRYVRERHAVDYGRAHSDEYELDVFEAIK
jgi:predicted methyltransferase